MIQQSLEICADLVAHYARVSQADRQQQLLSVCRLFKNAISAAGGKEELSVWLVSS